MKDSLKELEAAIKATEELTHIIVPQVKFEILDQKSKIYPLLNATAQKLIDTEIKTTTFKDKYTITEMLCVVKMVPINSKGTINMIYLRKWAKLLNFLADTQIWQHGVLLGCGAIKLAKYKDSKLTLKQKLESKQPLFEFVKPTEMSLFTFFHTGDSTPLNAGLDTFGENSIKAIGTNTYYKKLNKFIGWDVICKEGNIGDSDWSKCPF